MWSWVQNDFESSSVSFNHVHFLCAASQWQEARPSLELWIEVFSFKSLPPYICFQRLYPLVAGRWSCHGGRKVMVCLVFMQDFGICCHWVCRHWQASCHRASLHLLQTHTHTHPTCSDPYRCFEPLAGPTRLSGPPSREDHWDTHARVCVCVCTWNIFKNVSMGLSSLWQHFGSCWKTFEV